MVLDQFTLFIFEIPAKDNDKINKDPYSQTAKRKDHSDT